MMSEKQCRLASCLGQQLTVLDRKGKYLLPFVRHETGIVKAVFSTKGSIVIKYYTILLCSWFLQFIEAPQWKLQFFPLWFFFFAFRCSSQIPACQSEGQGEVNLLHPYPLNPNGQHVLISVHRKKKKSLEISSSHSDSTCLNQFVSHEEKQAMNSLMKQETLPKHTHTHQPKLISSRVIKNVSKPSQHLSKSHFLIKTDPISYFT